MSAKVPEKRDYVIPTLHIHLLGDFSLAANDATVTMANVPRLQSLLAYLVLHRNAPQVRSHLAFLLWPDSTEAQAHSNLRKLLHQLRQILPYADSFLRADRHSLHWLPVSPPVSWTLDVQDFEQALEQAEQADQAQDMKAARQALEQAAHLYRGDLLPDCYDEWILPERDRLRQLFFSASKRLLALLEEERDYEAAIKVAQHLLRNDPLHEATYRHLMRFHALLGDRVAALRVYHTCVTLLERELGTEPGLATRQAYETLLQMDASPPKTVASSLSPRGIGAPLVGRKAEWGQLLAAWRRAASGHPQMVILSGEAGIGKTRLAEELAAWASRQGMTTAHAHCYAAEGRLAYAPVAEWFRADAIAADLLALDDVWLIEVARLAPGLLTQCPDLPLPALMTEGWQRQHFFEALARALLRVGTRQDPRGQPLLLLLDDLQWCDSETLEWVHYLLRFESQVRLLIVGTVRSEEVRPEHFLIPFLSILQREDLLTEIALGPLNTTETISLAQHIAGQQLDPTLAKNLYSETEGNPLFVVEMVQARILEKGGGDQQTSKKPLPLLSLPASTLPPTVQTVLAARLAQLSPFARELASLAAVIGRAFPLKVLARASGESEDALVRGLDELWQRRIVREQDDDAYDFSHDKLREQAYNTLSTVHQRLLHRRVAEALEGVYADAQPGAQVNLDAVSRQIAVHYERAGLPWQAIPYYQRAGEVASRIYANVEAISAFQQAATLLESSLTGHPQQDWQWEIAARLYTQLGDLLGMIGRYTEARQAYQQGRVHLPEQASIWQADLQRRIAKTWRYLPGLETLLSGYKEAERILEQAADKSSLAWQQEWLELQLDKLLPLQLHRVSVQEMTEMIEKMQPIMEQYGTPAQQAQYFLTTAVRNMARDRYMVSEETVAKFRTALPAVQQIRNSSLIGFARFGLGASLFFSGHLDEAEEQMRAAVNVGEEIGNIILLERCLSLLPLIFRRRGQVEEVRSVLARAQAIQGMPQTGMIAAHRAWLAWRDGSMDQAEEYGKAALDEWQQQRQVDPHQCAGLWPLIGVALTQERLSETMQYVRMLLAPTQQPPPEKLSTLLEAAVQAWDIGQQEEARSLLQQAVPRAQEMGYL